MKKNVKDSIIGKVIIVVYLIWTLTVFKALDLKPEPKNIKIPKSFGTIQHNIPSNPKGYFRWNGRDDWTWSFRR